MQNASQHATSSVSRQSKHGRAAGGELLARLDREGRLSEEEARWCTACVIAALASLHAQGVVYRVRVGFPV